MKWEIAFERAFEYTDKIPGAFNWLSCKKLFEAAQACGGGMMVEVGVDQGRSASLLLAAARVTGSEVILVDSWESCLVENLEKVRRMTMDFPDVRVRILHMRSVIASDAVPGPIDLVHIDANHYDDSPDNDCTIWLSKVRPGGYACFHDFESCFPAVTEAVNKHTAGWEDLGSWESLAVRRKP